MGQAALARRKNQSKRLYVAGPRGFGLCLVFPAEILSFLRGQAYQVLLIRASRAALRACPKAEACLFRMDFREIHRHPVKETRSEEHTSELQSRFDLVCRLLLEKKKKKKIKTH